MHSSGCESKRALASRRSSESVGRRHLLRLVDQQYRPAACRLQVANHVSRKDLEPAPAIVGFERHGEDVAQLPIEIGQLALRMVDRADRDVGQS